MVATIKALTFRGEAYSFQSPFHRGNGCYATTRRITRGKTPSFSPLFIGAMVATGINGGAVSIQDTFSPLFIGAMVATPTPRAGFGSSGILSVPFSSGQWLLQTIYGGDTAVDAHFQSPFHRGNGCYVELQTYVYTQRASFSPLFIGAMVATVTLCLILSGCESFSPLFIGAMVATVVW